MSATLLHQDDNYQPVDPVEAEGQWVRSQSPISGQIVRVWKPVADDPNTVEREDKTVGTIACVARGIISGGIGASGTSEQFGAVYNNIDYVKMWIPAHVLVTKRDRITNITDKLGIVRWMDDEEDVPKATVFNVNGVTPIFGPFNDHIENFVFLERVSVG